MNRKAVQTNLKASETPDVTGVLARNVPTRLLEISRTGCLLESRQRVEDGTVGELQLQLQLETFVDDVRVTRCVLVEGSGSIYRVGAEFVQVTGDRIAAQQSGFSPNTDGHTVTVELRYSF